MGYDVTIRYVIQSYTKLITVERSVMFTVWNFDFFFLSFFKLPMMAERLSSPG